MWLTVCRWPQSQEAIGIEGQCQRSEVKVKVITQLVGPRARALLVESCSLLSKWDSVTGPCGILVVILCCYTAGDMPHSVFATSGFFMMLFKLTMLPYKSGKSAMSNQCQLSKTWELRPLCISDECQLSKTWELRPRC